jgi:hypothetical protein
MLRVTVELLPGGGHVNARVLDVIDVANESGDESEISDYSVAWTDKSKATERTKTMAVRRHVRESGRWKLLARVARDIADAG